MSKVVPFPGHRKLPAASPIPREEFERLSLPQTARFLFLVARVRFLDVRLSSLYDWAERRGCEPHGPTLLRLVRQWLAVHEQIGAMLPGVLEPLHVRQVRAALTMPETTTAGLEEADQLRGLSHRQPH